MLRSHSRRGRLLPVAVLLALLSTMVSAVLSAAPASAQGDLWSVAAGPGEEGVPGTVNVLGTGAGGDPSFSYYYCASGEPEGSTCWDFGVGVPGGESWAFQATASADEADVNVTYLWTGSHSSYEAELGLSTFTDVEAIITLKPLSLTGTRAILFRRPAPTISALSAWAKPMASTSSAVTTTSSYLQGTFTVETEGGPPPAAPTSLTATQAGSSVDLSWDQPATAGYGAATGYEVLAGTTPGGELPDPYATVVGTTASVTALPGDVAFSTGNNYYFAGATGQRRRGGRLVQ